MKNSCYYKNQDLLVKSFKRDNESLEILEGFLDILYNKLEKDMPNLGNEDFIKRLYYITGIEYHIYCTNQDVESIINNIESQYPTTMIQSDQTQTQESNSNEVKNELEDHLSNFLIGCGKDEIKTKVDQVVNLIRNYSAFFNEDTKEAFENLFILEGRVKELRILQSETKSKIQRKKLNKEEIETQETITEQIKSIVDFIRENYYISYEMLTQEVIYDENPDLQSFKKASEYFFESQGNVSDGGKISFETKKGAHFQNFMNLSEKQKELLGEIEILECGINGLKMSQKDKELLIVRRNKLIYYFLKGVPGFKNIMESKGVKILGKQLEDISPEPDFEIEFEEQEKRFLSYFGDGVDIKEKFKSEGNPSAFVVDILGNNQTSRVNYSGLYQYFTEEFDNIFRIQSANHKMKIEINQFMSQSRKYHPAQIQDRLNAIKSNSEQINNILSKIFQQTYINDNVIENEEDISLERLRQNYFFGPTIIYRYNGKIVINQNGKNIFQNIMNPNPRQKYLLQEIHKLSFNIESFYHMLQKYEKEGNTEKAMKYMQAIETVSKKQEELIKSFFENPETELN